MLWRNKRNVNQSSGCTLSRLEKFFPIDASAKKCAAVAQVKPILQSQTNPKPAINQREQASWCPYVW